MTRSGERDLSRIGPIDYALMTLGCCLSSVSGSVALSQPTVGWFCVIGMILGACFSYGMRSALISKPAIKLDGYFYALGILVAFLFGAQMQGLMPDGGYGRDVIAAGWLSWMLILGSFFTWQDSTLLFQAIPAIAFFGLSGIYDTFRGVTFSFFGFLICLATLFARAHRRSMLVQAAESGYFTRGLAPGSPTPSVETTPGLAKTMELGPWKWIAGPEWALFSALGVVLISLLGAPAIKSSMTGVSGFIQLAVPASVAKKSANAASTAMTNSNGDADVSTSIGGGPNHITRKPVFEAKMDGVHYLRYAIYDDFRGKRWSVATPGSVGDSSAEVSSALEEIKRPETLNFTIRPLVPMRYLPVPGAVLNLSPGPRFTLNGQVELMGSGIDQPITGQSLLPGTGVPAFAQKHLPSIYTADAQPPTLDPRVTALIARVTVGARNDFEKAEAIRQSIASRIKYNIDATAIPAGTDPVGYSLFDRPEGYCDVYATAMTLMARSIGIPARYCTGYLPEYQTQDRSGNFLALESDYHAWSELYFKDFGWMVFDATEGASSVPGEGRGASNDSISWLERPWMIQVIDIAIIGLALVGVFAVIRNIRAKIVRRTPRSALGGLYEAFSQVLHRHSGKRRQIGQTPDEYLDSLRPTLGLLGEEADRLNRQFVSLMFSSQSLNESEIAEMRSSVKAFGKAARRSKNN